jgi:hypothetical protein
MKITGLQTAESQHKRALSQSATGSGSWVLDPPSMRPLTGVWSLRRELQSGLRRGLRGALPPRGSCIRRCPNDAIRLVRLAPSLVAQPAFNAPT